MPTSNRSSFEQCALAAGLLTEHQLDEARAAVRAAGGGGAVAEVAASDQQLADRLVETGKLNVWQARQLLEGRTKFTLGPYRIVDSLGQGGMGQVFKAEHQVMGRPVAIKVLPRDKSTPEAIENFSREIQALARLNHRKLVRALDAGHDGNVYYLVTEYVPGCDLRKLVRRSGPLGMELAASIISQVAEGLQHAHEQGMIHRDVKPGNVLVTPEGEAKLSDLGLAGPIDADVEKDPRYGKVVGTADYLSPDHIASPWTPTPAWDIYSLGCTLYYAVTGKVPYPGGKTAEKARAHCELRPLDPRRLNPRLSDEFVDVIADMMAKDPAERIGSAAEVIERLSPWSSGTATGRPTVPAGIAAPPVAVEVPPGRQDLPPGFPVPPVLPPPVVRPRALTGPPIVPLPMPLPDTVADFPNVTEPDSDSQDSPSLIVTSQQPSLQRAFWLGLLAPLGLAGAVVLVWWLLRMFG